MKAWKVSDKWNYEGYSTVVFAETRNEAKSLALSTDACEDAQYIDIEARRMPELDSEYRGHFEMEWDDPEDRAALVAHGWACFEVEPDECETCTGKDTCEAYDEYLKDEALAEKYGKEAEEYEAQDKAQL